MKYRPFRLLARLRLGGRMSEKGADRAGLLIAIAIVIGSALFGAAAIIAALHL